MTFLRSSIAGLSALLLAASFGAAPIVAQAEEVKPPATESAPEKAPESRSRHELLDELFARLKAAKNRSEAKGLEVAIQKIWMVSGSPSIGLLMSHGMKAMAAKDYDEALYYFDEVVALKPDYAEGWNKRSAAHYVLDDYSAALSDLEHVLRLEPRHFNALAGLAVMLEDLGDKKGALDAYRRALALDPWLEGVPDRIKHLEPDVEGRGI